MSEELRSGWLARDKTGRELSDLESRFVAELRQFLELISPAQVEPDQTALTAEATRALICLIPHRGLGGLTLVATVAGQELFLSWGQIFRLDYHDDLDLAKDVGVIDLSDRIEASLKNAMKAIRAELERPIVLRITNGTGECLLRQDGEFLRVAKLGSWRERIKARFRGESVDYEVHFMDAEPPPIFEPSNAMKWFPRR